MGIYTKSAAMLIVCCIVVIVLGSTAQAHFSSTGFSDITVKDQALEYNLFLLERELLEALPEVDRNGDGKIDATELDGSAEPLVSLIHDRLIVTGDGQVGVGAVSTVRKTDKAKMAMIEIDMVYDFHAPIDRYMVQYNFYDGTNPNHRSFATIRMGEQSVVQVINSSNNILQMEGFHGAGESSGAGHDRTGQQAQAATSSSSASVITGSAPWSSQLREYTRMGMEHIWSGADHLLFLCGLLLAARSSWLTTVKLISAFTVGHSFTLVLSALELASLSPVIVEPLIALSIVLVAAENLYRNNSARSKRTAVTVLFGMVHGFGFAEILHGTMSGNVGLPLFSFNLGVEIGQLAVLAVVVPLLWTVRKLVKSPIWMYGASSVIGLMGIYWLAERLMAASW